MFFDFDILFRLEAELASVNQYHTQLVAVGIALVQRQVAALHLLPARTEVDGRDIRAALVRRLKVALQLKGVELPVHQELPLLVERNAVNLHHVGAFLYYDINFRASHKEDIPDIMENITENMSLASVVRGSNEDFEILYGAKTCDEAYNIVKEYCPYFIYTNADKPVELRTSNLRASFPVKQVETVSTIGAGDNFNAGFCYAIYKEGVASLETIKKEEELAAFSRFIASGQKFSSVVCQSLDNYVPKDFRP